MRTAMVQPMVTPMVRPMVNSEAANRYRALFDFNAKLLALPEALQRMGATYTRNSAKTVVQDGALVTLSANQFGTSYDPVTGLYGYVPEPAATNVLTYSQDLSQSVWSNAETTDTQLAGTAPDSTNTANKLLETAATGIHMIRHSYSSWVSGTTYTLSVFAKAAELRYLQLSFSILSFPDTGRRAIFDLQGGTVTASETGVTALIRNVGNGWYRCSISAVADASGGENCNFLLARDPTGYNQSYAGDASKGLLLWGAQIETGSRATSYIATTGSTASRAADVLSVPVANIPGFSAAGYTLFVDSRCDALTNTFSIAVAVDDGSTKNRAYIARSTTNLNDATIFVSGVPQSSNVEGSVSLARNRVAFSCATNSFLSSANGAAMTADLAGSMPTGVNTLRIGLSASGGGSFNGFIFRAGLIPQALTQAQINGLTTL